MVYIIRGKRGEGKTTKMGELFREADRPHGFVAEKHFNGSQVSGYFLADPLRGQRCTLALTRDLSFPKDDEGDFFYGPFHFFQKGFLWARERLVAAMADGAHAFFIDELGGIELEGRGHASLIRSALKTTMDIHIAVRSDRVGAALEAFHITEFRIVECR